MPLLLCRGARHLVVPGHGAGAHPAHRAGHGQPGHARAHAADAGLRALTGLSKAEVKRSRAQAPSSPLWIEFVEYKGVERSPLRARIQDRGAARLQLRVQNIDAVVSAMKGAGMTVVTQGGGAVPIPPNFKGALVADPNNFFLTPFEPQAPSR